MPDPTPGLHAQIERLEKERDGLRVERDRLLAALADPSTELLDDINRAIFAPREISAAEAVVAAFRLWAEGGQ